MDVLNTLDDKLAADLARINPDNISDADLDNAAVFAAACSKLLAEEVAGSHDASEHSEALAQIRPSVVTAEPADEPAPAPRHLPPIGQLAAARPATPRMSSAPRPPVGDFALPGDGQVPTTVTAIANAVVGAAMRAEAAADPPRHPAGSPRPGGPCGPDAGRTASSTSSTPSTRR